MRSLRPGEVASELDIERISGCRSFEGEVVRMILFDGQGSQGLRNAKEKETREFHSRYFGCQVKNGFLRHAVRLYAATVRISQIRNDKNNVTGRIGLTDYKFGQNELEGQNIGRVLLQI